MGGTENLGARNWNYRMELIVTKGDSCRPDTALRLYGIDLIIVFRVSKSGWGLTNRFFFFIKKQTSPSKNQLGTIL